MKIAVDESGNYALGSERFESYVLCALIVPDSRLDAVERFVEDGRADPIRAGHYSGAVGLEPSRRRARLRARPSEPDGGRVG